MQTEAGFREHALNAFDFLILEYGFRCVQIDKYFIRFESEKVFVEVYYDALRSFELDCAVGLLAVHDEGPEQPVSLLEILRLAGVERKEFYTVIQASTPERLAEYVPRLAELVKQYGRDFLLGDREKFDAVFSMRGEYDADL